MDGKNLVGIGLMIVLAINGVFGLKTAAVEAVQGDIARLDYKISKLNQKISDTESKEKKEELEKEIKELRKDQGEARLEQQNEAADRLEYRWVWKVIWLLGVLVLGFGLMQLVNTGSDYEKAGALVAIGFIMFALLS